MKPPPPSFLAPEGKYLTAFLKSCLNRPGSLKIGAPAILFYYAVPAASGRLCLRQRVLTVRTACERLTGLSIPARLAVVPVRIEPRGRRGRVYGTSEIGGLARNQTQERGGFGKSVAAAVRSGPALGTGGQTGRGGRPASSAPWCDAL